VTVLTISGKLPTASAAKLEMIPELPKRVAENINRFTGRAWLLPKLLAWWDHSDDDQKRMFLLTGEPGTGKSMILAWLAGYGPPPKDDPSAREQLARLRTLIKAAHFCQADGRNNSPQAFAESIANQLTRNVEGFGKALVATLADRVNIVGIAQASTAASGSSLTGVAIGRIDLGTIEGDERSFDQAFTQPLKKLYETSHTEALKPILLLVDALDEAQTYTGKRTLPELLSSLVDLPEHVRILATMRDDQRILKFFRGIRPFHLIRDATDETDDIRRYAVQRLTSLGTLSDRKRNNFAERLSTQAGGVFLYAAMVLDDLLKRPISEFPDLAIYPLPKGLSGLYHDFLNRELGKDERRWFDLYEPLLGILGVAQGEGLSATQLNAILGKDIRAELRIIKQYLSGELPEGPFHPFHKSFSDFLLEDKNNLDYHIDATSMHQRIAEYYWSKHCDSWPCADHYALAYVATHLRFASAWKQLERLLLDPSYVRTLCDLSNEVLADVYSGAHAYLEQMSESPHRGLLLQLIRTTEKQRGFTGRVEEMRRIEWFLETEWPQHLMVVGLPGMGKSALASQVWLRHIGYCLLETLSPRENQNVCLRDVFEKVYFDLFSPEPSKSGAVFYENIDPNIRSHVGFADLCSDLLNRVETSGRRVCIIIDELDAARGSGRDEISHVPLIIPRNLKIIWVGRRTPALSHLSSVAHVLELSGDNRPELLQFIRRRLGKRLGTMAREELIERILAQSGGSPLYIELLAQELDERGALESDLTMLQLPQSLSDLYESRTQALELTHPGIRNRLALLVGEIASQTPAAQVRLEELSVRFDAEELASIKASGLFEIERGKRGTILGIFHASALDFLRQRYGIG
jgi:hypothetical protein